MFPPFGLRFLPIRRIRRPHIDALRREVVVVVGWACLRDDHKYISWNSGWETRKISRDLPNRPWRILCAIFATTVCGAIAIVPPLDAQAAALPRHTNQMVLIARAETISKRIQSKIGGNIMTHIVWCHCVGMKPCLECTILIRTAQATFYKSSRDEHLGETHGANHSSILICFWRDAALSYEQSFCNSRFRPLCTLCPSCRFGAFGTFWPVRWPRASTIWRNVSLSPGPPSPHFSDFPHFGHFYAERPSWDQTLLTYGLGPWRDYQIPLQ